MNIYRVSHFELSLRGYSVILRGGGGGGGVERVYIFYIYENIYRVPHFEIHLRGYSVILGLERVYIFIYLCEHLSSSSFRT